MYPTRYMRLLRLKHGIPLSELAIAARVTHQRISQIELSSEPATSYHRALIAEAFAIIAEQRGKDGEDLRRDLHRLEYSLLDFTEKENINEL